MFARRQLKAKFQRFGGGLSALVLFLLYLTLMFLSSCRATAPGDVETRLAAEAKKMKIGGKDWQNPSADTPAVVQTGMEHFQHHCQVCHGLDGHSTGVPFAAKMSPPYSIWPIKTFNNTPTVNSSGSSKTVFASAACLDGKVSLRMTRCGVSCASYGIFPREGVRAFQPSSKKAKKNTKR